MSRFICLCFSFLLTSCAYSPFSTEETYRISPDYIATGTTKDINAFVYGNHTILEFDKSPYFLTIKDKIDNDVVYERVGRYYRLSNNLDIFTVSYNLHTVKFREEPTMQTKVIYSQFFNQKQGNRK